METDCLPLLIEPLRLDDFLIVRHETTLPMRCPFCNAEGSVSKTLHFQPWHQLYSPVRVGVYLCEEHFVRFRSEVRMAGVLAASGVSLVAAGIFLRAHVAFLSMFFVVFLTGVLSLAALSSGNLQLRLWARKYKPGVVWIGGLNSEFLQSFKPVHGSLKDAAW